MHPKNEPGAANARQKVNRATSNKNHSGNGDEAQERFLNAQIVAEALGGARRTKNGYDAYCPAHDDRHASLSIREGDDGKLLVHCHANCAKANVIDALKARDLWPSSNGRVRYDKPKRVVDKYPYRDEHGKLRYQVVRFEPKTFRQQRKDANGEWIWNMDGVEPLPYRLSDILDPDRPKNTIFIVEGEKDADAVAKKLGLVATCNHGGAGKWRDEISPWFKNHNVVALPDNDDSGRKHIKDVAQKLIGIAASIRILELPGLSEKGDVSDWIAAGGTREKLLQLAKTTPEYTPTNSGAADNAASASGSTAKQIRAQADDDSRHDREITKLNETYALVLVGDKAAVLKEDPTAKDDFTILSVGAFKQWYGNRFVRVGKKGVPLADFWLEHPLRRQYEGIVFAPTGARAGYYNLWHGFAVEPKVGHCSRFLTHLRENVCRGREPLFNWVVGWLAEIVQHPERKSGTSLAIRGRQGTGKTIVGKTFGSLLGAHYVLVADPRYITGRFNSHLAACLLLHADEGFWAGDHAAEGKLKDLITGDSHLVEYKGKEPFRLRNYVRLLVTGNQDWVVPAGMEERRFAVLEIGSAHMKDTKYFAAIEDEMENGGRAALLHFLLQFDLGKVDLRTIPLTTALLDQKLASLPPEQGWWLDVLQAGQLPDCEEEAGRCRSAKLFDDYVQHANRVGARRRQIETRIGVFLRKMVPGLRKRETDHGVVYEFPSLGKCRERFCDLISHDFDWGELEDWTFKPTPFADRR